MTKLEKELRGVCNPTLVKWHENIAGEIVKEACSKRGIRKKTKLEFDKVSAELLRRLEGR